jgi:hypothetical protein
MRRTVLVAVLAGALVGLAVVAGISLAGGSSSSGKQSAAAPAQGSFAAAYAKRSGKGGPGRRGGGPGRFHGPGGHGPGMGFGPLAIAFQGFAKKLDVTPDKLREAIKGVKNRALDRAVADGTITQDERDALDACMKSRGGSGCDRAKAMAAHRKLHKALEARAKSDAAGLKSQFIGDLATELGKQPADVEAAARSELSDLLATAVTMGFITEHGRDLALGCFDKPNECDRAALRAEVKKHFREGRRHGGRGPHGPGGRHRGPGGPPGWPGHP